MKSSLKYIIDFIYSFIFIAILFVLFKHDLKNLFNLMENCFVF